MFLGLSAREWASILGSLAFAGLLYRTISTFDRLTTLERAMSVLLLASLVIGAIGSYRLDMKGAPPSDVIQYALAHRILVVFLVIRWNKWVGRTGTWRERLGIERRA